MNRPHLTRWLRIAVSAVCVVACALLTALWGRSYWKFDLGLIPLNTSCNLRIITCRSRVAFCISPPGSGKATGHFRISPNAWMHPNAPRWMSGAIDSGLGGTLQRNFEPYVSPARLNGPDGRIFTSPIWVLFGLSGIVATVPWLPWPTRFSLRALLIVTKLVAVALGFVMWSIR